MIPTLFTFILYVVRCILEACGDRINGVWQGRTALGHAVQLGRVEAARAYLDCSADLDTAGPAFNDSTLSPALLRACRYEERRNRRIREGTAQGNFGV